MTFNRLLTTAAAVSVLAGLAPLTARAQPPKTEAAAALATGKGSTDGPAATAVQGTAKAVKQSGAAAAAQSAKPVAAQEPAATPAPAAAPMPATTAKPVVANGDLVSTLRLSGQFTTLVKALDATNLSGLLSKNPNLTLFAPTDAAFAALPPGQLDKLMADKPALQKLLTHHVINAVVDSSKIKGAKGPVPSVAGDPIELDGSEDVLRVDNAKILQPDVKASNGVLHVVDHVLIAGSVPPTTAAAPAAPAAGAPASTTTTTTTATTAPTKK